MPAATSSTDPERLQRSCLGSFHVFTPGPHSPRVTQTSDLLFFQVPPETPKGKGADPTRLLELFHALREPRTRPDGNFFIIIIIMMMIIFLLGTASQRGSSPGGRAPCFPSRPTPGGCSLRMADSRPEARAQPGSLAVPRRAPPAGTSGGPRPAAPRPPLPTALTCAFFIRNGSAAVQPSRPCANSLQLNCSSSMLQRRIVHALGLPSASPELLSLRCGPLATARTRAAAGARPGLLYLGSASGSGGSGGGGSPGKTRLSPPTLPPFVPLPPS